MEITQQTGEYHIYLMAASGPQADDFVTANRMSATTLLDAWYRKGAAVRKHNWQHTKDGGARCSYCLQYMPPPTIDWKPSPCAKLKETGVRIAGETIVAAAIQLDGTVYSVPAPGRHHNVMRHVATISLQRRPLVSEETGSCAR